MGKEGRSIPFQRLSPKGDPVTARQEGSGEQRPSSGAHVRLDQGTEDSETHSLSLKEGMEWLPVLYIKSLLFICYVSSSVSINPKLLIYPSPHSFLLGSHTCLSISFFFFFLSFYFYELVFVM